MLLVFIQLVRGVCEMSLELNILVLFCKIEVSLTPANMKN